MRTLADEYTYLIGYPLEEASEILKGEGVKFEVVSTASPKNTGSEGEVHVIAVQGEETLTLIYAQENWGIS